MRHESITSRPVSYARQVWLASLEAVQVLQKEDAEIFHKKFQRQLKEWDAQLEQVREKRGKRKQRLGSNSRTS